MDSTDAWRGKPGVRLRLQRLVGKIIDVGPLSECAFRVRAALGTFFIKFLPDNDALAASELRLNQRVLPLSKLRTPRLLHEIETEDGTWGVWEWLDGSDLRFIHRELLPQVFASLAEFHIEQRGSGLVYSPATRLSYPSVSQMMASELLLLTAGAEEAVRGACWRHFQVLATAGYPTLIHGDMHPGNVLLTTKGPYIVDWAYALPSLNLLDLDYIDSLPVAGAKQEEWWRIRPEESGAVLRAYFQVCGQAEPDPEVLRALMVWAALRSHYNLAQQPGHEHDARCYADVVSLLA